MGGASRWWLHQALESLNLSLQGKLNIFSGDPLLILPQLAQQNSASSVVWNRCYEPWRIARDGKLKAVLKDQGTEVESYNGSLLWEPWQVLKKDGTPTRFLHPIIVAAVSRQCNPESHWLCPIILSRYHCAQTAWSWMNCS